MFSRLLSTAEICTAALFTKYSINVIQIELEKMSLSEILNLRTVFYHVDAPSHVFSSELRENPAISTNAIVFKTINHCRIFYWNFEISIKFYAF